MRSKQTTSTGTMLLLAFLTHTHANSSCISSPGMAGNRMVLHKTIRKTGKRLPLYNYYRQATVYSQWFSTEPLASQGDMWQYVTTKLSQLKGATGNQWEEARDAAKHPTMHRTAFMTKNYLAQIIQLWSTVLRMKHLVYSSDFIIQK